jgi:hypothetical protein
VDALGGTPTVQDDHTPFTDVDAGGLAVLPLEPQHTAAGVWLAMEAVACTAWGTCSPPVLSAPVAPWQLEPGIEDVIMTCSYPDGTCTVSWQGLQSRRASGGQVEYQVAIGTLDRPSCAASTMWTPPASWSNNTFSTTLDVGWDSLRNATVRQLVATVATRHADGSPVFALSPQAYVDDSPPVVVSAALSTSSGLPLGSIVTFSPATMSDGAAVVHVAWEARDAPAGILTSASVTLFVDRVEAGSATTPLLGPAPTGAQGAPVASGATVEMGREGGALQVTAKYLTTVPVGLPRRHGATLWATITVTDAVGLTSTPFTTQRVAQLAAPTVITAVSVTTCFSVECVVGQATAAAAGPAEGRGLWDPPRGGALPPMHPNGAAVLPGTGVPLCMTWTHGEPTVAPGFNWTLQLLHGSAQGPVTDAGSGAGKGLDTGPVPVHPQAVGNTGLACLPTTVTQPLLRRAAGAVGVTPTLLLCLQATLRESLDVLASSMVQVAPTRACATLMVDGTPPAFVGAPQWVLGHSIGAGPRGVSCAWAAPTDPGGVRSVSVQVVDSQSMTTLQVVPVGANATLATLGPWNSTQASGSLATVAGSMQCVVTATDWSGNTAVTRSPVLTAPDREGCRYARGSALMLTPPPSSGPEATPSGVLHRDGTLWWYWADGPIGVTLDMSPTWGAQCDVHTLNGTICVETVEGGRGEAGRMGPTVCAPAQLVTVTQRGVATFTLTVDTLLAANATLGSVQVVLNAVFVDPPSNAEIIATSSTKVRVYGEPAAGRVVEVPTLSNLPCSTSHDGSSGQHPPPPPQPLVPTSGCKSNRGGSIVWAAMKP